MNRLGTALLAAIEAVGTVGVGLGIAVVPLTLLWGFEYGLQVDWDVFWTAAGSVWLVGHGVDVSFVLGTALAGSSGVSGAGEPFHVTLAALGFAIVTAWLGGRAGRRFAETEHRTTGLLVGTAVVAVLGLAVALSTTTAVVDPVVWQAVVLPALWFAVPALATSEVCRRRRGLPADALTQRVLDQVDRVPTVWRSLAGFGLRAGTAATAAVVTVAGVVVTLLLFTSFAEVIALYERSHAGVVGGIALTVGQLAFLPDFVGWAVAWIVGPGFAIGTGSSVSPVGTVLGPIPGLPVFGALPASGHTFGLVWVLVPVVAGFVVGGLLRPRLVRALGSADTALHRALGGVAAGIVAGLLTGGIAWLTSGSFGPGRLAEVGPHALVVGAFAALEVGVPAAIALAIGSDLVRLPEGGFRRERWHGDEDTTDTGARGDDAVDVAHTGSLLAALDEAGAGRTTDVHRFVVEEAHGEPTTASRSAVGTTASSDRDGDGDGRDRDRDGVADRVPARPASPVGADTTARTHTDGPADADGSADADRPTPVTGPARAETDVELPEWARTDVVAADRLADAPAQRGTTGRGAGLRDRIRGAADGLRDRADGLRDRAEGLRDRVTGADAVHDGRPSAPAASTPVDEPEHTDVQPAFPWSTEEFVAGRDETDEVTPASSPTAAAATPTWDRTDQIPEDELPWWRRPSDRR